MKKILFIMLAFFSLSFSAQGRMKDYSNIMKSRSIYEIDAFLRDAHRDDPRREILKPRLMDLIKDYLKTASPEDQQVKVLQEKLALLRKRPSTKITFDEMNENIRQKVIKMRQEQLAKIQLGVYKKAAEEAKSEAMAAAPAKSAAPARTNASPVRSGASSSTKAAPAAVNRSSGMAMNAASSEKEEFAMLMNESADEHKAKTVKILNALFDNDPMSKETTILIKNSSDCDIIVRIDGIGYTKYRLPVPAKSENTIVVAKGDYLFSSLVCGAQYASQKTVQKAIMVTLGNPK